MNNRELKRTDTKAVSSISNKYDKPQKNSRKIDWDEDKSIDKSLIKHLTDSELMPPPPPIPKGTPPLNKRPKLSKRKDSPYPKKTIKKTNKLTVKRYSKIIY